MKKKSSWEVEKESKEYLEILEIQQGVTDWMGSEWEADMQNAYYGGDCTQLHTTVIKWYEREETGDSRLDWNSWNHFMHVLLPSTFQTYKILLLPDMVLSLHCICTVHPFAVTFAEIFHEARHFNLLMIITLDRAFFFFICAFLLSYFECKKQTNILTEITKILLKVNFFEVSSWEHVRFEVWLWKFKANLLISPLAPGWTVSNICGGSQSSIQENNSCLSGPII